MQQKRATARPQQQQQPMRISDPQQQQAGGSDFQPRIDSGWQMGDRGVAALFSAPDGLHIHAHQSQF